MRTAQAVCQRFWGAAAAASGVLYLWLAVPVKTHGVFQWEQRVAEVVAAWQRPWFGLVHLRLHWPADVVGGVLAGVAYLSTGMWFLVRARPTTCPGG